MSVFPFGHASGRVSIVSALILYGLVGLRASGQTTGRIRGVVTESDGTTIG